MLTKSSVFPEGKTKIFSMLGDIKTLQYVAYPFAVFIPIDKTESSSWDEGGVYKFKFKLFGVIPFGIHTISVVEFGEKTYRIYTNESSTHVPIWNHKILLSQKNENSTEYTDEVEINAGWKTPFVYLWARCFYSHRQRKWIKLLQAGKTQHKEGQP